ncbi:MAG: YhcN/YlaJ family sporulation lipoprotein [Clostridiales bacterium]|jgi:hypothetical protein|nr:YhcN/YlaJ family sporulation lipoprotein [Clostridiales bacterium]
MMNTKKILYFLPLLIAVASAVGTFGRGISETAIAANSENKEMVSVYSENNMTEQRASELALSAPKVQRAEVFVYGDIAVVAVRCNAVFFRSENLRILNGIRDALLESGFREAYVTKDAELFYKMARAREEFEKSSSSAQYNEEKKKLLAIVKEREKNGI